MRALIAIAAILLALSAAWPAKARIVGILFDDSGGMGGSASLPAWGAQLLVSTLDGRRDRLFTARMSRAGETEPVVRHELGDPEAVRSRIALTDALATIVGRVSRTDLRDAGAIVERREDGFVIRSPFAITRIVALANFEAGETPKRLGEPDFAVENRTTFRTTSARPLSIAFFDNRAELALAVEPLAPRPGCGPGEIVAGLSAEGGPIGRLIVDARSALAGRAGIAPRAMPDWLALRREDGAPFDGFAIEADDKTRIEALLVQKPMAAEAIGAAVGAHRFEIAATPPDGALGTAAVSVGLRHLLAEASLAWRGEEAYAIDLAALDDAERGSIELRPEASFWARCFLCFRTEPVTGQVTWTNGAQSASASMTAAPALGRDTMISTCGVVALALLALLYLLLWARVWATARRFPKKSCVAIREGGHRDRLFRPLRGAHYTALRTLMLRPPHETRSLEGVVVRAARNGVELLLDKSDGACQIDILGVAVEDCRAENTKRKTLRIGWGDLLERRARPRLGLIFLSSPNDLSDERFDV